MNAAKEIKIFGMWLSLVERLVWVQEVAGSNPVIPTNITQGGDYYVKYKIQFWHFKKFINTV